MKSFVIWGLLLGSMAFGDVVNFTFPGVGSMTKEEKKSTGVSKLNKKQIDALNWWLSQQTAGALNRYLDSMSAQKMAFACGKTAGIHEMAEKFNSAYAASETQKILDNECKDILATVGTADK